MKSVFAVTINFNTEKETLGWLASMKKLDTSGIDLHLVIVDNASVHPFKLPEKENAENVTVLTSDENLGFTGGNNIGINYALENGADYLLIINNDTFADENLLTSLVSALEEDEAVGLAVPKIYFAKGHEFHKERYAKDELGKVFWYAGGFTDWNNVTSVHRGVDEVDHGQYDKKEKVNFASGCCMFIKREVFKKVGIFDDKYFLYFEDADLDERIHNSGYSIIYAPKAILWHINAASSGGSGNKLQDYFMARNRMLFGMRYAPFRTKIALFRESIRLFFSGRPMQKKGIKDFYLGKFGKGTYFD